MEVMVGPMRLFPFTPVMLETIVDQSPSPRILSQLQVSVTMVSLPSDMNAPIMK